MSDVITARQAPRTGISAHYERVDTLFTSSNLTSRDDYGRFLTVQASAHFAIESRNCFQMGKWLQQLPSAF